jgi:hypothetical protein
MRALCIKTTPPAEMDAQTSWLCGGDAACRQPPCSAAASSRQLQQPVASIRLIAAKIETLEPTRMPKRSCVRVAQEMRPP